MHFQRGPGPEWKAYPHRRLSSSCLLCDGKPPWFPGDGVPSWATKYLGGLCYWDHRIVFPSLISAAKKSPALHPQRSRVCLIGQPLEGEPWKFELPECSCAAGMEPVNGPGAWATPRGCCALQELLGMGNELPSPASLGQAGYRSAPNYLVRQSSCSVKGRLRPQGTVAFQLLCLMDHPGKNPGVRCHSFSSGSAWPTPLASPALVGGGQVLHQ